MLIALVAFNGNVETATAKNFPKLPQKSVLNRLWLSDVLVWTLNKKVRVSKTAVAKILNHVRLL